MKNLDDRLSRFDTKLHRDRWTERHLTTANDEVYSPQRQLTQKITVTDKETD